MKKLLLLLALCISVCLVGCNKNENNNQNNNQNNLNTNQPSNVDNNQSQEEPPIVVYDSPDFSEKAGFKVTLNSSLEGVKYDSIFLMNNSTAQLDLVFPDNSIGTLLVDSTNSTHIYNANDAALVGDINVSIESGADGINVYEWSKDN